MNRLSLGLLWGFALGMGVSGYLSYLEARTENARRHTAPHIIVDDMDGAEILRALRKHQRQNGRTFA